MIHSMISSKILRLFVLLAGLLPLCAFSGGEAQAKFLGFSAKEKEYDVLFRGTPVGVHVMGAKESADAVEGSPRDQSVRDLVVFKIDRVMKGEFAKTKRGGASRIDQAINAAKKSEVMDVVGLNFKNPADLVEKELVRIAVKDAGATFGLTPGEGVPNTKFAIYLKRTSSKPESFLFIKSQPIPSRSH